MKSVKQLEVGQSPHRLTLFAELETLQEGEVWEVTYPDREDARRELKALRAWIYWERKRRKAEVLMGIESGSIPASSLDTADPLTGLSMFLQQTSKGGWKLVFSKSQPFVLNKHPTASQS